MIACYKKEKAKLRQRGGYPTQKALMRAVTEMINKEFSCDYSELQVQNKWKSLERAYRNTKKVNNSSGSSRAQCQNEEDLEDVLEKEHHVSPTILVGQGKTLQHLTGSESLHTSEAEGALVAPLRERQPQHVRVYPPKAPPCTACQKGDGSRRSPQAYKGAERLHQV